MIKYTTHFICYLNEANMVHCAKCRKTGKFIKRSIAQDEYLIEYYPEYSTEYAYKRSLVALLIMFAMFLWDSLKGSKMSLQCEGQRVPSCKLQAINKAMQTAYKQHDYVLFKQLNRKRFELINGSI